MGEGENSGAGENSTVTPCQQHCLALTEWQLARPLTGQPECHRLPSLPRTALKHCKAPALADSRLGHTHAQLQQQLPRSCASLRLLRSCASSSMAPTTSKRASISATCASRAAFRWLPHDTHACHSGPGLLKAMKKTLLAHKACANTTRIRSTPDDAHPRAAV
jgi:hypothetical protein